MPPDALPPPAGRPALRIGFFGVFHPRSERAGSFSTSLVYGLAQSRRVAGIEVFAPRPAALPPGWEPARVRVRPEWAFDDPVSLLRTFGRMWSTRHRTDVFVFSIYVTAFGRGALANAVGLVLPGLLRRCSGVPVVVYMHNFLETQD